MSENLPMHVNLELNPRLFADAINSTGMLMSHRGTRVWTFGEDAYGRGNLDGMETLPRITNDLEVGRLTEITGKSHGVSYSLEFIMYNEIAGAKAHNPVPMLDMRITATVGDAAYPEENGYNAHQDSQHGALRGLIWLHADRTSAIDFGHGTTASSNPECQAFLERLISYYGIDAENLFGKDARQSFVYDDDRLERLTSGLHELTYSDL